MASEYCWNSRYYVVIQRTSKYRQASSTWGSATKRLELLPFSDAILTRVSWPLPNRLWASAPPPHLYFASTSSRGPRLLSFWVQHLQSILTTVYFSKYLFVVYILCHSISNCYKKWTYKCRYSYIPSKHHVMSKGISLGKQLCVGQRGKIYNRVAISVSSMLLVDFLVKLLHVL